MREMEPVIPIVDNEEDRTLMCPKCGKGGQRENRRCCAYCEIPFLDKGQHQADDGTMTQTEPDEAFKKMRQAEIDEKKRREATNEVVRINKEKQKKILSENLNVDPARWSIIISIVFSVLALILIFLPTSKAINSLDADSNAVWDVVGKNLLRRVNSEEGIRGAFAAGGVCAAILMPILNLTFLLKNNPMQRGIILYESVAMPAFAIYSLFMPIEKYSRYYPMKLNATGIICISACVAVFILGIVTYARLEEQSEKCISCIDPSQVKRLKRRSRKQVLREARIRKRYC